MSIEEFVKDELKDYETYKALEKRETDNKFKKILKHLIRHEFNHYNFWLSLSKRKDYKVNRLEILFFVIIRTIFGLTFTIKLLEKHEKEAIKKYNNYLKNTKGNLRKKLKVIIRDEQWHEKSIIDQIKEERVKFIGAIVLGINDGLIELTGALAGLTATLQNNLLVAFSGLIVGIAAAMSMAASSYQQSKQEGKEARKYALYTGVSYFIVVAALVFSFFIIQQSLVALASSVIIAIIIVFFTAIYVSVLFNRNIKKELAEMLLLSLGIALITFLIGNAVKIFIKI